MQSSKYAWLLIVVAGCSIDLTTPENALIECESNADCPPGKVCRDTIGRCVAPGSDDVPPQVEDVNVLTPFSGPFLPARVSFSVSETLSSEPAVRLGSTSAPAFTLESTSDGAYIYTLVPDAGAEEGGWPILGVLTDTAGNTARDVALGTLVVDHTAPEIVSPTARYWAAPGNPLPVVDAARDGTRFVLYFSTTEPITEPTVTAECGGVTLALTPTPGNSGTFFSFELTLATSDLVGDGACELAALFEDLAGNPGDDSALAEVSLAIDRTAPNPDVGIDLADLKQVRAPYGAWQTSGVRGQFLVPLLTNADTPLADLGLPANAFTAESNGAIAEVHAYSAAADGLLLGVIRPNAGGYDVPAMQADSPELWLSIVDAAGNESERRKVPVSEWVVTLGGKRLGSAFENPVTVERTGSLRPTLIQDFNATREPTQDEYAAMVANDGDTAVIDGEGVWRRLFEPVVASPPGTYRKVMTYDPVSGGVYLFGGYSACGAGETHGGLWRWDGVTWQELGREEGYRPGIRDGSGFAPDPRRRRLVLFSGAEQGSYLDTWEWDLANDRWIDHTSPQLHPPNFDPPPFQGRRSMGFAYDSGRDRFVMFSGVSGSGRPETDFWEWDADSNLWTAPTVMSASSPAPRNAPGMVYDAAAGVTVLFGGWDYDNSGCPSGATLVDGICVFGDTWTWDGTTQQWTLVAADGVGPPGRANHVMVYDPVGERVLMMGGDRGNVTRNDLWQWTPTNAWQVITPSGGPPSVRTGAGAAFDAGRNRLVLHAGERFSICPAPAPETWEWDPIANRWENRTPTPQSWPDDRMQGHFMASLGSPGGVVMYGGFGSPDYREVWRFDGAWRRWTYLSAGPTLPVSVDNDTTPAVAVDRARNQLVVIGQYLQGTTTMTVAEMNLTTNTWSYPGQSGDIPWPRTSTTLAYDPSRSRVVLFGGTHYDNSATPCPDGSPKTNDRCYYNDLREWSGSSWLKRSYSGGPSGRFGARMDFDDARDELVIIGGQNSDNQVVPDHWRWNGVNTTMTATATTAYPLTPANLHTVTYDPLRDKIVAYSGNYARGYVLEYDTPTDTWTERQTSVVHPAAVRLAGAAFDYGTQTLFAFGGEKSPNALWEWSGGANTRPAMVFEVPIASSGSTGNVSRILARVRGTGRGFAGVTETSGLRLLFWDVGRWHDASALSTAANEYELSLSAPGDLRRALTGDVDALIVAVTPDGDNAQSVAMAEVDIDAVEFRVLFAPP